MIQTGQYLGTLSKLTLKSGAENPRPPLKQTANFTHVLRNDLMPDELETIVLEIKVTNNRPFLVIVWYRPQSKIEMFDHIERVLYSCEQEGKDIIMLGDLNCDLLAEEPCCYTKRLNNIISTSHQLITEATRITESY